MSSVIRISNPIEEDIEEIHSLFQKTVRDNFLRENIPDPTGKLVREEINALEAGLQTHFNGGKEVSGFLIARIQGEVVGTVARGKPSKLITHNVPLDVSQIPEIKSVYVYPNIRIRVWVSFSSDESRKT